MQKIMPEKERRQFGPPDGHPTEHHNILDPESFEFCNRCRYAVEVRAPKTSNHHCVRLDARNIR